MSPGDARPLSAPQRAMRKLGLVRDIDLALHLPLRYEDETRIVPIASLRDGETAQVEGTVRTAKVETRARRQLVVHLDDGSDELVLRFLHFYPSHQRALAPGQRVRVRGEVRGGWCSRCSASFSVGRPGGSASGGSSSGSGTRASAAATALRR